MDKTQIQERKDYLLKLLQPGERLYTSLKHVSKSGMYRVVDVFYMKDNEPLRLSWSVAVVVGFRYDRKHEGIGVSGCGMDVGFEVVYNLGYALYPNGFYCIGENCPSNDHSNNEKRTQHPDGGYAFRQQWL